MTIPTKRREKTRLPGAMTAVLLSLVLAACGGGGTGSNAGSGNSLATPQQASGTVTGFGSVFVDGTEIEDATAAVVSENMDGTTSTVALKMGQRVRVVHDGKGTASRVTVDAAVIGSVSSVDTPTSSLKVAGQWVRANADSAAGPVTAFGGGYTAVTDVAINDLVEVHGSPVYSSTRAAYEIQATRIEMKPAITAIRVMGQIAGLTSTSFNINGLTVNTSAATTVVPATATLANSMTVAVWGTATSVASATAIDARRIRVFTGANADNVPNGAAQLGGLVASYDKTAATLNVQGVKVNVSKAVIAPATKTIADLANGSYIAVAGVFGTDGVLAATSLRIRESDTTDDTARIKLKGAITSLTDTASFVVRGIPVDASSATLGASCTAATLVDGTFVNVVATAQAGTDVVKATSVDCVAAAAVPALAIREAGGTVTVANLGSKTFTIQLTKGGTQAALWNEQTAFTGLAAADLKAGMVVKVEGYLNAAGTLVAREIHLAGTQDQDAYDKPEGNGPPPANKGWNKYQLFKAAKALLGTNR